MKRQLLILPVLLLLAVPPLAAATGPQSQPANAADMAQKARPWSEKGAICATYGNHEGAVRYFSRAISLDPTVAYYFFGRGVSLGEMGRYGDALRDIDHAIELDPNRPAYYYGRGWVHLLAGEHEKALADFKQAAEGGNQDAIAYLTRTGETAP
jgi:tetratricopeptide (TPR) repeat protein